MDTRALLSHLLLLLLLAGLLGSPRSSPSPAADPHRKADIREQALRRFPGRTYDSIRRSIRGAAAIAMKDRAKPFASGVLIARDTVLTARHATYKHARVPNRPAPPRFRPEDLEVRFDYQQGEDGSVPAPRTWPVMTYIENTSGHDWILLELGTNEEGELPRSARVQRLATTPAALDDPVYVVGYPKGGPLEVADDARVLFPFETTRPGLEAILDRAEPADRASIRGSYARQPNGRYRNYSAVFRGHPTIGIDSDTVAGMSGAGVYLKRTGRLVGILIDGQPDTGARPIVDWWRHEAVAPIPPGLQRE